MDTAAVPDDGTSPFKHWTVDKRIPLALIGTIAITIFLQTMGAVWWASAIGVRLDNTSTRVEALERSSTEIQRQGISIAKLEEKLTNVQDVVKEIRASLVSKR